MYALRIQFHQSDLNLQFKDWQRAKTAFDRIAKARDAGVEDEVQLTDDYNRHVCFEPEDALFILLQDLDQEVECSVDMAKLQQRAQNRAQAAMPTVMQPSGFVSGGGRRQ